MRSSRKTGNAKAIIDVHKIIHLNLTLVIVSTEWKKYDIGGKEEGNVSKFTT